MDTAIIFDYSVLSEDALGATTEEKMAEMAAKQLLDIRESRMELLTGDTERGYDGASLQKVLDQLETTERKLTELFVSKNHYPLPSAVRDTLKQATWYLTLAPTDNGWQIKGKRRHPKHGEPTPS